MSQVVLRSWHDWSNTFDEFLLENVVVDVVKNVMSWHDEVLLCLVLVTLRFHLKLPLWQSTPPPSLSRGTFVDITQRQIVHLWCRIDHIACLKNAEGLKWNSRWRKGKHRKRKVSNENTSSKKTPTTTTVWISKCALNPKMDIGVYRCVSLRRFPWQHIPNKTLDFYGHR